MVVDYTFKFFVASQRENDLKAAFACFDALQSPLSISKLTLNNMRPRDIELRCGNVPNLDEIIHQSVRHSDEIQLAGKVLRFIVFARHPLNCSELIELLLSIQVFAGYDLKETNFVKQAMF